MEWAFNIPLFRLYILSITWKLTFKKNNTHIFSAIVLLGQLAVEAKSSYVKDMMLVDYGREVKSTFADEEYLREKL